MSFGISKSDVTHGIFCKQALEFPRVMSPMGFSVSKLWNFREWCHPWDVPWASFGISESDVTHGISRKLWISSPALAQEKDKRKCKHQLLKTAAITHHSRKTRCNFHRIYSLIRFLKTWTIKSILDSWKRIMSGIISQVQQKRKNTLWDSDEYPILCSHTFKDDKLSNYIW